GELALTAFAEGPLRPGSLRATWNTLVTASFGALLALAIGAPFAIAVAMTDLPGRKALGFLLLMPLIIAPQVTVLSWLHLAGPSSTLLNPLGLAAEAGP